MFDVSTHAGPPHSFRHYGQQSAHRRMNRMIFVESHIMTSRNSLLWPLSAKISCSETIGRERSIFSDSRNEMRREEENQLESRLLLSSSRFVMIKIRKFNKRRERQFCRREKEEQFPSHLIWSWIKLLTAQTTVKERERETSSRRFGGNWIEEEIKRRRRRTQLQYFRDQSRREKEKQDRSSRQQDNDFRADERSEERKRHDPWWEGMRQRMREGEKSNSHHHDDQNERICCFHRPYPSAYRFEANLSSLSISFFPPVLMTTDGATCTRLIFSFLLFFPLPTLSSDQITHGNDPVTLWSEESRLASFPLLLLIPSTIIMDQKLISLCLQDRKRQLKDLHYTFIIRISLSPSWSFPPFGSLPPYVTRVFLIPFSFCHARILTVCHHHMKDMRKRLNFDCGKCNFDSDDHDDVEGKSC